MIQELFGGSSNDLINRDRNISIFEPSPSPSPSPSSSSTITTTTAAAAAVPNPTSSSTTAPETQKLRCPRCDSSHTKFCYYNNYNLTQPRHFCKTCRRYWTKGGALRNVPIGGGCRKNKGTTIAASVGKPISANGKLKAVVSSELIGKSGFLNGFEHEFAPNPNVLWAAPPQTSHLLSLLRATQNQNPNPSFALNSAKDQGFMIGSNLTNLGFDSLGQTSSLGLCSSLWRTNQTQENHPIMGAHQQGQNPEGNQGQLYQRLRSSSPGNYYHQDQTAPVILGGNAVANTSSSTILESAPVAGGGGDPMGFWNPTLPVSWSDLPTSNGAYP